MSVHLVIARLVQLDPLVRRVIEFVTVAFGDACRDRLMQVSGLVRLVLQKTQQSKNDLNFNSKFDLLSYLHFSLPTVYIA